EVARQIRSEQGEILTGWTACRIHTAGDRITGVTARNEFGHERYFAADYVFSTMPVKELVDSFDAPVSSEIRRVSDGLLYRDFITVGLLLNRMNVEEAGGGLLKDNWIYIQEPDVLVGRLQIFNNWSPFMTSDPDKVWIGLEYFCYASDELWSKSDRDMT